MKNNNKRISIDKIAKRFDGRSRACEKCPSSVRRISAKFFEEICIGICTNAYVRGFKKGVKYEKQLKKKTL